jgi:hypothetical protein
MCFATLLLRRALWRMANAWREWGNSMRTDPSIAAAAALHLSVSLHTH